MQRDLQAEAAANPGPELIEDLDVMGDDANAVADGLNVGGTTRSPLPSAPAPIPIPYPL